MTKTNPRVLVTGINGFVGSHLAKALIEDGKEVHGLTRSARKTPFLDAFDLSPQIKLFTGDIRERELIEKLVRDNDYSAIYHLASQSDTWKSRENPYETFDINVNGTLALLEAMRKSDVKSRLVIGSSVRVFQDPRIQTENEYPIHPYDASKAAAEVMALSYIRTYGFNGAIAQNTNAYGPNDYNFSRLIPKIMKGVLSDGIIRLRGDGKIKRDFLYVEDMVQGMIALSSRLDQTKTQGKSYTFASGVQHSIREVVETVNQMLEDPVPAEWDTRNPMRDRDQDPLEIETTQKDLAWKPTVNLKEGLTRTLNWYREYFT